MKTCSSSKMMLEEKVSEHYWKFVVKHLIDECVFIKNLLTFTCMRILVLLKWKFFILCKYQKIRRNEVNHKLMFTWYNQLDEHTIPCFLRRTVHILLNAHLQGISVLRGHLCLDLHLQCLDKPCQRMGNDFYPEYASLWS